MGSIDRVDDRTFRVNFSGDGANRLREKVNEKLKEYMGDYTDDTLVEYVIVLLKNGRSKEEARNELNVFLGDDSDSFVSWLWDDLASNFDLYVQPQESCEGEATIIKSKLGDQQENNEFHHVESESDRGKSHKEQRVRHHREWKGLARDAAEPPPLRSSEVESIYADRKTHRRTSHARRSPSPRSAVQKKRRWPDEQEIMKTVQDQRVLGRVQSRSPLLKRESAQGNIDAPRRLLQFAVRDAVAMSRPSISATEPSLKRLRSVVSTSTGDSSLVDHPRRLQSVARVPNPMATVIKAVAEASEDVKKVKTSGSVFDRLGRGMDVSETVVDQLASYGGATTEDGEYVDVYQNHEQTRSTYFKRSDHRGQYVGDETVLENGTGLASDSMSENEGYDDVNICSVTDVSQTVTSAINRVENPLMMQYSVAKNSDDTKRVVRNKDHAQPSVAANNSQKIVNISVNVNTWKPPHYQEPREVANVDGWKSAQEGQGVASKSGMRVMKENSNPVAVNGNEKLNAETQKESQKIVSSATGLYAAGRPLEDADSRTLFVTNVHFAATKDSLSRHFNKFGDVLKVVIITDPATGQPIGSAYVEFMRKEAADNALSLDGTSFMSRILKVVRRSAAHQETAPPSMTWPRARGSTFATPRFPGVPFPRGLSSSFRPRPLIKPGARSMQWKRDAQPSPGESGAPLTGNVVPSPTSRSLTYVRPESKPETKSGTT